MNLLERLFSKTIDHAVERRVKLILTDADGFYEQHQGLDQRDRYDYDREEILRQALEAWRLNPLARRLVMLTSQYIIGGGIQVSSKHKTSHNFLVQWWEHPLNRLALRLYEWSEELIRSGEIFIVLSTDAAGMTYVRAIPPIQISDVITEENDLLQEVAYIEKDHLSPSPKNSPTVFGGGREGVGAQVTGSTLGDGRRWKAYDPRTDELTETGSFEPVMLHYAINRPAGAVRGESDLAPMLRWLTRYSSWLEDRVRLNRFRQAFLYTVKAKFTTEAERLARQTTLNTTPPNPGSILVTDESETWGVIHPNLDSFEAKEDGLAIKKMIASGAGVPLHFLAEPEGTNKTTAESAGGPTFRHFEQRQEFFTYIVKDVARAALRRRAMVDRKVRSDAPIEVRGTDLSSRDNITMAQASGEVITAFTGLYEKGLIDGAELVRLAYRFAGETVDIQALLDRGEKDIQDRPTADSPTAQPPLQGKGAGELGPIVPSGDAGS